MSKVKIHSLKHNAKAAAKRVCARFSGIEVIEPAKLSNDSGETKGWLPAVAVKEGVLPSSIAPEVLEAAHIELPEGWMVYNGNSIQRVAEVRGVDSTAARFAALNPDRLDLVGSNPAATLVVDGEDVTLEEAQDAAAFMSAVAANGGTNDGMGRIPDDKLAAALESALAAVKPGSKEEAVFTMLLRPAGATVAEIAAAMTWELHTTRAYISVRTRKRGVVAVTEKVDGRGRVYRLALPAPDSAAA